MAPETNDPPAHVFQSYWSEGRLSPLEHLCIKSFIEHGHTFVLYAYDEVTNVPTGCVVQDARAILPKESFFRVERGDHVGSPAPFSDRFRYELLRARGGWWIDTDVVCLADQIPDTPYVFAKQDENTYVGGILRAPPDSDFLRRAIERCKEMRHGAALSSTVATGPALVNELVRELGLERHAWAREGFYPLGWDEALLLFDPAEADAIEARSATSMFLHVGTGILLLGNVLKDVRPPEGSYLDRLYRAYDVEFPESWRYTWDDMRPQYEFQKVQWSLWDQLDAKDEQLRHLQEQNLALHRELDATREQATVLQQMKVVRWSAPARRLVYRLRDRRE